MSSEFTCANIFKALIESCGLKKQSKARVADFPLEANPVAKTLDDEIFSSKWSNGVKWYNGIQANQGGVLSLRLPQREISGEVDSFMQLLEDNFSKHASVSSVELIKDKDGYLTVQIKMKAKIRSAPDDIRDSVNNILERTEFKEPGPGKTELIAEVNAKKELDAKKLEEAKRAEEKRLEGLRNSEIVQSVQRLAGRKLVYSQEPISKQLSASVGYNSDWSNGIRWSVDRSDFVDCAMIRLPHFDSSAAVTDLLEVFKVELAGESSIFSVQLIRNRDGLQTIQVRPKRDAERLSPAAQEKIANILSRVRFAN